MSSTLTGSPFSIPVELPPTADSPDLPFAFHLIRIQDNAAQFGGGIYVDALQSSTPNFGPSCNLTGNVAYQFGGALYFKLFSQPLVMMIGGLFEQK